MKLSEAIRAGSKLVAKQARGRWFYWDARLRNGSILKPPNCACAVAAALLAVGYRGPWDDVAAHEQAIRLWGNDLVKYAAELNDRTKYGFRAIATRVAEAEA